MFLCQLTLDLFHVSSLVWGTSLASDNIKLDRSRLAISRCVGEVSSLTLVCFYVPAVLHENLAYHEHIFQIFVHKCLL